MKKITILICVLIMTVAAQGASTDFMVNLASAKHKAAIEGKLYMVHFTATWCTPCKWMNAHTFTDDRVAQYLTEHYVPVKINVDDFDGIVIKQKNNVQFLPTLLIFNSKGEEVGRFEEAIGPSKLMLILEENNIAVNKEKFDLPEPIAATNPEAISRPLLPSIFDDSIEVISTTETNSTQPELTVQNETTVYTPPVSTPTLEEPIVATSPEVPAIVVEENLTADPEPSYTAPITESPNTNTAVDGAAESLAFLTGEGIFELDVKYKQKRGYSVQIGLYARYENVLAEVNKFKQMYQQNIYVHIGKVNGIPVYRLLMGSFDEKSLADQLELRLKSQGLDCFVNDMSKI